jgi:tRNA-binding EMAP/Myf-like protein
MLSESEIRRKIRQKMESGAITEEQTVWGGPSTGMVCVACDERIEDGGSEVEVLCVDGQRTFYHAACFLVFTSLREGSKD